MWGELQRAFAIVVVLLGWFFATNSQAQPATLTLACEGTTTDTLNSKRYPLSMEIGIDLTDRTVSGFFVSGSSPITITDIDDVMVTFSGQDKGPLLTDRISGRIDLVTGELAATLSSWDDLNHKRTGTNYSLHCRPAQRMF